MAQAITARSSSISQSAGLTFIRIALGIILIWKSVYSICVTAALKSLIGQTGIGIFTQDAGTLALVVTILTLSCGFFIRAGLFTRLASNVQPLIVLAAAFLLNLKNLNEILIESILIVILLLLILFAIKGIGMLSIDANFRKGAAADKVFSDRRTVPYS
jgi:putative oxidoreductase